MSKRLWITWEVQRRNRSMSKMLGASLHELTIDAPSWKRYPTLIARTASLVWRTKPEVIFSQNPSIVLAGLSVVLGKVLSIPVIIDAHNAGLFPTEGKSSFLNKVAAFINNRARIVIVSNDQLKTYVEESGGKAYAIPDPIPDIKCRQKYELDEDVFNIVFVCSWADDEPYHEVIQAAKKLDASVRIYMTGNSKKRHELSQTEFPDNVVLTGFLSNKEYDNLLCTCDAIMVLTKREGCLVCGAYEGVAVEKPLVLSNKASLKQYFKKGCVYSENTEDGICEAIKKVVSMKDVLSQEIIEFKASALKATDKKISDFENLL